MYRRNHNRIPRRVGRNPPAIWQKAFMLGIIFALAVGLAGVLHAQDCNFQQINEPGWEDPNSNLYAWSMTGYTTDSTNYLYVGTNNWEGGQIWRTMVPSGPGGPYSWEKILDTALEPLGPQGNSGFRNIVVFNGEVYAGSRNESGGCQLWRSDPSGENFQMVVGPGTAIGAGFGNPDNESVRGLHVFGAYLYIGLQNTGGGPGELWRTMDGVTYTQVALPADMGGAASGNDSMHTMAVRDGKLYIATRNLSGGLHIWSTSDGVNFTPVVGPGALISAGFGDSAETTPLDLHVHNGFLFVGLVRSGGFNVYRIDDDDIGWTQVAAQGLGDRFAYYAWRMESHGGYLWLGTYNYLPLFFSFSRKGAALYRSDNDGDDWELIVGGTRRRNPGLCYPFGFNDRQNFGIRSFAVVDGKMFIGTGVCPNGCSSYQGAEVWVLP